MCLIIWAIDSHPDYSLILAANRDEYYQRPALPASYWEDCPHVLAGRDLEKLGTWLGITRTGRLAAITNYRDPALTRKDVRSRGELVSAYLCSYVSPETYLQKVKMQDGLYNGFNLLVGEKDSLYYYSNIERDIKKVLPGIHGLSNHLLDTPWPKVIKAKRSIREYLDRNKQVEPDFLFQVLSDNQVASLNQLPRTGVNRQWEQFLSSIFIAGSEYGTRSSTVLLIDRQKQVSFYERTYNGESEDYRQVAYEFSLN